MSDLVRITPHDTGAFWQVTFGGANGNILDRATVNALSRAFVDARAAVDLKAICLEGAGPDFSFGASIQEHFPEHVTEMIGGMRSICSTVTSWSWPRCADDVWEADWKLRPSVIACSRARTRHSVSRR
jgi:enoyl-CoA hydratase/carnithine racemase